MDETAREHIDYPVRMQLVMWNHAISHAQKTVRVSSYGMAIQRPLSKFTKITPSKQQNLYAEFTDFILDLIFLQQIFKTVSTRCSHVLLHSIDVKIHSNYV